MTRSDYSKLQDYANPPHNVRGEPTTIRLGEVVGLNTDHTLDVKPILSRATKFLVSYPLWYVPAVGDVVLYTDLNGDPRTPIVITPMWTASGDRPYVHVAFADYAIADADG